MRPAAMRIGIALAAHEPHVPFLAEQLGSILAQTWSSWTCVVSCDSPLPELRRQAALAPFFADTRFTWSENPRRLGLRGNFERAVGLAVRAGADAIALCDQDDLWYPHKLERTAAALRQAPPLSLVHADADVVDQSGRRLGRAWELERRGVNGVAVTELLVRNVVTGATSLFDAALARRFPVIPEGVRFHDHWYAAVAACHGGVHPVAEALSAYRQHGGNVIGLRPYRGLRHFLSDGGPRGLLRICREQWSHAAALARGLAEAGVPLGEEPRAIFLRPGDRGARLCWLGARRLGRDRALARACLAVAVGKALGGGR